MRKITLLFIFWHCYPALAFMPQEALQVSAEPPRITLPAGQAIAIRTVDTIDSKTASPDQEYAASLDDPLVVNGVTVAPAGAHALLRVSDIKNSKLGRSSIAISLTVVIISEQKVKIATDPVDCRSGTSVKKLAKGAATGAAVGAIGGSLAGPIGVGVGAAAGTVVGAATLGRVGFQVPPETRFTFNLTEEIELNSRSITAARPSGNPALAAVIPPPPTPDRPSLIKQTSDAGPVTRPAVAFKGPMPSMHELELIGVVYFQDESGRIIPLERTTATPLKLRMELGGWTAYWEVQGVRSPVRLKKGQKQLFVVRLATGIDPGSMQLSPFDLTKKSRRTKPDPKQRTNPVTVLLNVTKISQSTYGLIPVQGLSSGEYCFSPRTSNEAYCFGVDTGWADSELSGEQHAPAAEAPTPPVAPTSAAPTTAAAEAAPTAPVSPPVSARAPPPTITLGMTVDQIVAILGQPTALSDLGAKKIYVYPKLKVTFQNGSVADIE
jgi:hypothetical protein